jgi:hypothetical protein
MRMPNHRQPPRVKTANAVADPVLVHIEGSHCEIALLADDVIFDQADVIRLLDVKGVTVRSGLRNLLKKRTSEFHADEVLLRRHGDRYLAVADGRILAPASYEPFHMENLSAARYQDLATATPYSIYQAASPAIPHEPRIKSRRNIVSRALRAIRFATMQTVGAR